jgi:hypothetical protein
MSTHLLVTQLHFVRSEFQRCLADVSDEDARKRPLPMNCISWIVGHLANQENALWVFFAQGLDMAIGLNDLVGYGRPASTPPLDEMWAVWREITSAADRYLDTLTVESMSKHLVFDGKPLDETIGTKLMRNIYHYWYHIGQAHAVREMLGHRDLPDFVGDMSKAFYYTEK